jgi:hypothetical protein
MVVIAIPEFALLNWHAESPFEEEHFGAEAWAHGG